MQESLVTPTLVLVTGLPGTGKSTVAETISIQLGAPVVGHDWAMSGLRPFPEIQQALDRMEPSGHRVVGWSILTAIARSQLRGGRSVIIDGVARAPEIEICRQTAVEESARLLLVATDCSDAALHRSRIEGRRRQIPGWYELEWQQVEASRRTWEVPEDVDIYWDSALGGEDAVEGLSAQLRALKLG
jgi:predicted kinase